MTRREFEFWALGFLAEHFAVDEPESLFTWIRSNVWLTAEESKQFPGFYNPDLTPGVTILFNFVESPQWKEFFAVKSSQFGVTLAFLAALMHKIRFNPKDVGMVINNREEIKRIGDARLDPMLLNCKAIADRIPADRKNRMQTLTKYLLGLTIYLAGGQAAGAVANKSLDWGSIDEVDETPEELRGGESTIIDLMRDRFKRQDESKLFVYSKPRNEDDIIWPEYLHGSRHKIFVPCPHCAGELPHEAFDDRCRLFDHLPHPLPKGYQTLVRSGLRYQHLKRPGTQQYDLPRVKMETFYECLWCKGEIRDRDKAWMLRHRLYLPTNTPDGALQDDCVTFRTDRDPTATDPQAGHPQPVPGKLSFHCSDFYALSHQPDSTFGDLAVEIVTATNLSKQRKFCRSREGLPVKRVTTDNTRSLEQILALQGKFARGHCSRKPTGVIMGVDVQHYGRKWVKACFYADDDSAEIVDYGIVYKGFEGLIPEALKPVIVDDWGDTPEDERINPTVDFALIDEGDGAFTKRVLAFCRSKGARRLFWPARGRGGQQTAGMPDLVCKQKKNVYERHALPRYIFNSDAFHEECYDERIGRAAEIAKALEDKLTPPAGQLRFYKNPDTDLCIEFTTKRRWTEEDEKARASAKKKPQGTRRGKVLKVGDWFRDGGPEDFADAFIECLAGWYKTKPSYEAPEGADDEEEEPAGVDTADETE